jgi:hypothetical protein
LIQLETIKISVLDQGNRVLWREWTPSTNCGGQWAESGQLHQSTWLCTFLILVRSWLGMGPRSYFLSVWLTLEKSPCKGWCVTRFPDVLNISHIHVSKFYVKCILLYNRPEDKGAFMSRLPVNSIYLASKSVSVTT